MRRSLPTSVAAILLAAALAMPATAGQVYGDYGQHDPDARADADEHTGPFPGDSGPPRSACGTDEAVGTGLGAIVGGIIGNQFGKGSGKAAATVGGVIIGGIAGNAIARDACQDRYHDAYYYNDAYYDSFNAPDDGERYVWNNPYTHNYGYVTAGPTYEYGYQDNEGPCRAFTQQVWIEGRAETATGVACRRPDGTWRIVGSQ